MNKIPILFLITLITFSCTKDDPQAPEVILPFVQTQTPQAVRAREAVVIGKITRLTQDSIIDHGFVYSTENISSFKQGTKISLGETSDTNEFSAQISGLEKNTKYFVRTYVSLTDTTVLGAQVMFTTQNVNEWISYTLNGWPPENNMVNGVFKYGLAAGGNGYLGFGLSTNAKGEQVTPLYELDLSANALKRLPDYPPNNNYYTTRFQLKDKIYVIYDNDKSLWRFDTVTKEWKQMSDLPVLLSTTHAYNLFGQGYVIGTNEEDNVRAAQIWQYNEVDDEWKLASTVPPPVGTPSVIIHGVAVINNIVYILFASVTSNPKLYAYDPNLEKYTICKTPPLTLPEGGVNNYGLSSSAYGFFFLEYQNFIWQYFPIDDKWIKIDANFQTMNAVIINDVIYIFNGSLKVYSIE